MTSTCGLFGKHPMFGDFISIDVQADVQAGLQGWLDGLLPELRNGLGAEWDTAWDAAPTVRFWVGRGLVGQTLAGVVQASRDSVGRRYPLVLLAQGGAIDAPVVDRDQTFYDGAQNLLDAAKTAGDIKSAAANLAQTVVDEDTATRAEGPLIWAHNEAGDLDGLLGAAVAQDQRRAVTARSYWWVKPQRDGDPAMWLGHAGLPDARAMGWLLFGRTIAQEAAHA